MTKIRDSIRTKFIIYIMLTMVIFLGTILFASFNLMRNYSLTNAKELSYAVLNDTDEKINRFFEEIEQLTRSFANYKAVYNLEIDNLKDLIISTVLARKEYMRAIYLGTKDGRMYEWGNGVGFNDHEAILPDNYDPRKRPWYKAALKAGGYTITKPYIYASVKALGITSVIPIYNKKGEFVGVLGIDFLLDDLKRMVENLNIPMEGKAILINKKGEIIVNQLKNVPKYAVKLRKFKIKNLRNVLSENEGSFIESIEGKKIFFSFKKNSITNWTLMVALPYNVIMAPADRTIGFIVLIDLCLMAILLAIIAFLSNKIIIKPLGKVMTVIKKLEKGEQNARVEVKGTDEFAVLGRQFNRLVDTVKEYSDELEEKVKKRTEEVTHLQQENVRLRIIEEKERIFSNLHDSLGARLTNIFISNSVAQSAVDRDQERLKEMHKRIENNCQLAIRDLKEIIFNVDEGNRAIIDFAKFTKLNVEKRLKLRNITLNYKINNSSKFNSLDRHIRFEIEKLLQELTSNVLKHSNATVVSLEMNIDKESLSMNFRDNGSGFDPQKAINNGFGLKSMYNRVDRLNGTMNIKSSFKNGSEFFIVIPIKKWLS